MKMRGLFLIIIIIGLVLPFERANSSNLCESVFSASHLESNFIVPRAFESNLRESILEGDSNNDHIPFFASQVLDILEIVSLKVKEHNLNRSLMIGKNKFAPENIQLRSTLFSIVSKDARNRVKSKNVTYFWYLNFVSHISYLMNASQEMVYVNYSESSELKQAIKRYKSSSVGNPFYDLDTKLDPADYGLVVLPTYKAFTKKDFIEALAMGYFLVSYVSVDTQADGRSMSPIHFLIHDQAHLNQFMYDIKDRKVDFMRFRQPVIAFILNKINGAHPSTQETFYDVVFDIFHEVYLFSEILDAAANKTPFVLDSRRGESLERVLQEIGVPPGTLRTVVNWINEYIEGIK